MAPRFTKNAVDEANNFIIFGFQSELYNDKTYNM